MPRRRSSRSHNPKRTRLPNERPEPHRNLREVRIFRAKSAHHRAPAPATADLDQLQEILDHRFSNRDLLERALTHKSRVYEKNAEAPADNEQLEFLGDAV